MKKIFGSNGRVRFSGMAAAVGCLAVFLGWTGAAAQGFQAVTGGFDATHSTGSGLSQWEVVGDRGAWSVATVGGRTGAVAPAESNNSGFLILRASAFSCSNDGTYTVTFSAAEAGHALNTAAIVFRYTGSSSFYALRVRYNYDNNYHPVLFSKGVLHVGNPQTGEVALGDAFQSSGQITLTVELSGSRIRVLRDGVEIGDFTDTAFPSGQVGYAQGANWNRGAVFMSSSWRNREKSVPANYLAWNTQSGMDFNPGTGGNWLGGATWSPATTATAPAAWIDNRSALFNAGTGTSSYSIAANGAVLVDTLRFETNGFRIVGATGTSTVTSRSGRVTVPAGVSANIDAVLAGSAGLTLAGGGTLIVGGTGANTYTGTTTISGSGTIVAAKGGALGTGAVNVVGEEQVLRLSNATLNNSLITVGSGNLSVSGASGASVNNSVGALALAAGAGAVIVEVAQPLAVTGVISGARGLAKTGTAVMTLTGENSHSGATEVRAGTLQIGATGTGTGTNVTGGASGSLAGSLSISTGATAVFSRSGAVTQTGVSGAGSLVKQGTGTLTLAGTNTHTGTTVINGGAISITSAANLGSGALTVLPAGRLILNAAAGTHSFAREMTIDGTFEKAGTGTVNLTSAISVGTLDVSGGVLNVNPGAQGTGTLVADSISVRGGARLAGTAGQVGRSGARVAVTNGTLAGKNYSGNVVLGNGGVLEQATAGLLQISGTLTMNTGSRLDIGLTSGMKATSTIQTTGALTLGGTLNITSPVTDADTGTYRIITGLGSATGTFSGVTFVGQDPLPMGYLVTQNLSGNIATVTIRKRYDNTVVNNPLSVTSAVLISDGESSSTVSVTVSGFDEEFRSYLTGTNPGVTHIHIWYKPGSRVTVGSDTTAAGGRHTITIPLTQPITGSTRAFTVTVPGSASARDTMFFFNVSVDWRVENDNNMLTPSAVAASAYLRDPKSAVAPNGLEVRVTDYASAESGISFELAVSGQESPLLTPNAEYKPRVDQVAVWVKRNGRAPALASGNSMTAAGGGSDSIMIFTLDRLRQNGVLSVNMARVQNDRADTIYFAIAPHWTGAEVDSIARPLYYVSQVVVNPTLPMPNNPVRLSAEQRDSRVPSVEITLGVDEAFNEHARNVRVELSFESSMTPLIGSPMVYTADAVAAGIPPVTLTDLGFVGEERLVYYRITVLDVDGYGVERPGSFTVGRRPPTPLVNFAAEPLGRGAVLLRWDPVTAAGNNVGDASASTVTIAYSASTLTGGDDISALPGAFSVPATMGEARVPVQGELEPETDYWFAGVLNDIVDPARPAWNLSSEPAIIMQNTGPYNAVSNIIRIDTVIFREAQADFMIIYRLLFDNLEMIPYRYAYDVALGSDTLLRSSEPRDINMYDTLARDTVITANLGSALRFDTTYRVHMYTVGEGGTRASGRAMRDVAVGAFRMQTIHIVSGGEGAVNNGKFHISSPVWDSLTISRVSACTTLVRRSSGREGGEELDELFVYLGDFGYRYNVKAGSFVQLLQPFTIRMRVEEVPPGYSVEDVRMYRWTGSFWEVLYDWEYDNGYITAVAGDIVERDTTSTYRLLISKQKPVVFHSRYGNLTGGSASFPMIVDVNLDISETFTISSSIGNFRAQLLCAPASPNITHVDSLTPATVVSRQPEKGRSQLITYRINQNVVVETTNNGLFSFLIVDDGRNVDTINISRQVRSAGYSGFPVAEVTGESGFNPRQWWLPFASQVSLDNRNVREVLEPALFAHGDEFATHDTLFRLFRWHPNPDNARNDRKWVEYNGANDDIFSLEPGRLMWIKTSQQANYAFGACTSASLIDTFRITLPPNQWTDFVLPFRYNITAGDILAATDGVPVQMYRWITENRRFKTERLAFSSAVFPGDSARILRGGSDAFTVFNASSDTVRFKVPPRPAFMSRFAQANASGAGKMQSFAEDLGNGLWYYTISAGTANSPALNDVMVGYNAARHAFAVPPSFDNVSVVILGEGGREMGHYFGPELNRGGTFTLRFYNDERQRATFGFSANKTGIVPAGTEVTFVDAVTGREIEAARGGVYSITVAGASYRDVHMVVGGRDYSDRIGVGAPHARFSVGAVMVNMAARSVRIRYYAPFAGVARVEASAYDMRGRQLWRSSDRVRPSSWNTIEWRSRESRRGAVAAGMYIIRVRAIDANGRTVAVENRRVTFAR